MEVGPEGWEDNREGDAAEEDGGVEGELRMETEAHDELLFWRGGVCKSG